MVLPGRHGMYMIWSGGYGMVYGMTSWAWLGIWLWPGRQGMGLSIIYGIYGMTWWAWHGIWYGLAGMACI